MVNLEIIPINEKEIMVGDNRTTIIEGNIIYVIAKGEQTAELAMLQKEINLKLASLIDGKICFLVDLNKCGKNSPEARLIWKELSENSNTHKVAVFGLHPVARVLATFVLRFTSNNNNSFFTAKEEALSWLLKQEDNN